MNHLLPRFNILIRGLKLVIQSSKPGSAKRTQPPTCDRRHLNRNGPGLGSMPPHPTPMYIRNDCAIYPCKIHFAFFLMALLPGHIWVNRLNAFTSLNERVNKALLFLPALDPREEDDKTSKSRPVFISGQAAAVIKQCGQCCLSSLEGI